jgi:hypothetical protein
MFIATIPNRNSQPAILLREGYREDGKVKTRTLANLTGLPPEKIEALKAALRGEAVGADPVAESTLPHGHVLGVTGMIHKLGLDVLLFGKRHHLRELSLALVAGRVIEPGSKLSLSQALAKGAEHHNLVEVLGLGELGKAIDPENPQSSQEKRATGEFYFAMDWMLERQEKVEDAWPSATSWVAARCFTTFPPPTSKGTAAPWRSTGTAGTTGKTAPRSNTACRAAGRGFPWPLRWSRAIPAIPRPSRPRWQS